MRGLKSAMKSVRRALTVPAGFPIRFHLYDGYPRCRACFATLARTQRLNKDAQENSVDATDDKVSAEHLSSLEATLVPYDTPADQVSPHSQPEKAFRGIMASLGISASIGNNFKPDPLLRTQLTVANQNEVLEATMIPLAKLPYEDQLSFKYMRNKSLIRNLSKTLSRRIPNIQLDDDGLICPLDPVVPSPVLSQFRNKDELSVGKGVDGFPKRVGYYVGRSRENNLLCISPETLSNMKEPHKLVGKKFEEFITTSRYEGCRVTDKGAEGYWKCVVVRSTRAGDLMGIAIMHPQSLTEEELEAEKGRLKEFFVNGPGVVCNLQSLYFQACPHAICTPLQARYELLFGKEYLIETCGHLKFRISPSAFFQLNVEAAESLYRKIGEILKPDSSGILLDVCCGTGAIGLFLSSRYDKVIGVEKDILAVGDATFNAELNDITNATYFCGGAEKMIPYLLKDKSYTYSSVSAVVNPGRGGLPSNVMNALRKCPQVDRVVYVSCKPIATAMRNLIDLCLPTARHLPGEPFYPVRAVPVDMFPHTDHCELVIVFERNRLYYI